MKLTLTKRQSFTAASHLPAAVFWCKMAGNGDTLFWYNRNQTCNVTVLKYSLTAENVMTMVRPGYGESAIASPQGAVVPNEGQQLWAPRKLTEKKNYLTKHTTVLAI